MGALTVRLLHGARAADLQPIESARVYAADWRALRRWGLDEARLPAGTEVLFRDPSLWSQYRAQILGIASLVALQSLLIVALLLYIRKRRVERTLSAAEDRYRHVVEAQIDLICRYAPDTTLTFVNETFDKLARDAGFFSDALMAEIARRGTLHDIPGVPAEAERVFRTAHDVGFEWHVRHQAAFQRHTDNGVSKTINLPESATEEDVAAAYRLAWDLGCLGITVFRDGSKVATAPAADLTDDDIIRLMIGRPLRDFLRRDAANPGAVAKPGDVALAVSGLSLPGRFADITFEIRRGEILGIGGLVVGAAATTPLGVYLLVSIDPVPLRWAYPL